MSRKKKKEKTSRDMSCLYDWKTTDSLFIHTLLKSKTAANFLEILYGKADANVTG